MHANIINVCDISPNFRKRLLVSYQAVRQVGLEIMREGVLWLEIYYFMCIRINSTEINTWQKIRFFSLFVYSPSRPGPPYFLGFEITLRHPALGRVPPDERSAHRRDLCLRTHNTHKRQASVSPAGFEPAREGPQTHTLDRAATEIGRRY
jgi:hypothetical protein